MNPENFYLNQGGLFFFFEERGPEKGSFMGHHNPFTTQLRTPKYQIYIPDVPQISRPKTSERKKNSRIDDLNLRFECARARDFAIAGAPATFE